MKQIKFLSALWTYGTIHMLGAELTVQLTISTVYTGTVLCRSILNYRISSQFGQSKVETWL
jgi:hypothetical protein